jgi:hypothetical protein
MSANLFSGKLVIVMPELKPRSTEPWLVGPSRQSITPAVRLLRDTIREKCTGILDQLIEGGSLDEKALAWIAETRDRKPKLPGWQCPIRKGLNTEI